MTAKSKRKAWDISKVGAGAIILVSALSGYVDLRGKIRAQDAASEVSDVTDAAQSRALGSSLARIRSLEARIAKLERRLGRGQDRGYTRPQGVVEADLGPRPGYLAAVGDTIKGAVTLPFRGLWALVRAIGS